MIFIVQNRSITLEILYTNMIAMCGGNFTGYFKELEHRKISELLWLMDLWLGIHKPVKNDTGESDEYQIIDDPEILKALKNG